MESKRTNKSATSTTGRLEHHVADFCDLIKSQGYSHGTLLKYHSAAQDLQAVLVSEGLSPADLCDRMMDRLTAPIKSAAPVKDKSHCQYRLERFRDYLIEHAEAPNRIEPEIDASPRACLRREYETYLKVQRGLADSTIYHCLRFYDLFLTARFGVGLGDLDKIKPDDVTGFMLKLRQKKNAPRDKTVPSHLRNLFKFLFWSGQTQRELSRVVPKVRQPKPASIPRYLMPDQVNRLIEVVRDHKKTGRRNYAMLMLIARLGLRAPEVTAIELDDIDWRVGELLIRGKGQLHDRMPLPVEVGEAIVDYIQNERRGVDRALFVSVKPPFKRFKDSQILRWILRDAYDATGIRPPQSYIGSHILRHSLATDMLRKGASLEEIGDVLRHRSPLATTIYAQHDVDALRAISRPWPVVGEAQ